MIGEVQERRWSLVSYEAEETPPNRTLERNANFAYRAEAEAWLAEQTLSGFATEPPCPIAMRYFGPTDSPSNAWSARSVAVLCERCNGYGSIGVCGAVSCCDECGGDGLDGNHE